MSNILSGHDINESSEEGDMFWNIEDSLQKRRPSYKMLGQNWSQRENTETNRKYVCSRCGKAYKATTSLSRHIRLECGVIPAEICPLCNRRFRHKFVLNSHIVACQRKLKRITSKEHNRIV